MNRNDLIALAVLIGLLFLWTGVGPQLERQWFPPPPTPEPMESAESPQPGGEGEPSPAPGRTPTEPVIAETPAQPAPPPAAGPARTETLSNDEVELTFSNQGASLTHARLMQFRAERDSDRRVEFDFRTHRPLSLHGIAGFGAEATFAMRRDDSGPGLVFSAASPAGVTLTRRITLEPNYLVRVSDVFSNTTARAQTVPSYQLQVGEMGEPEGEGTAYGVHYVGVDALVQGGRGVEFFGKKDIPKAMKSAGQTVMDGEIPVAVDWIAVKNRFFAQILTPADGGEALHWHGRGSFERGFLGKSLALHSVAAAAEIPELNLEPGQAYEHAATYYLGPKKLAILHRFGRHQEDIMDFGMFAPICKVLLMTLNVIHNVLWPHNYGLAIMLLTIIIRVLFWPVTHKGTDNMRRMQDIQPHLKELQAKYKDNPQKLNTEMMKLYKEHKVNPMMGCLPMLVQIPVFIALFVVLRSAIELRFAEFLWISDLSEPEDLLAGIIPFGGLRILPIFYAVSMLLQQKIMPMSGGNPQQEKIMQFMPIMMLFIFYGFASGLVLYWITNQALMLTQQFLYQRKKKRAEVNA